jgi:hypothetical protein
MADPGNTQQTPPLPPQFEGLPVRGLPMLSLWETFVGLFLFPHIVLLAARRAPRVRQAAFLVTLVWIASSLFMGLTLAPRVIDELGDVSRWLGQQMGELRRTDKGMAWKRPADAPKTVRFHGFRVDFAAKGDKFDMEKLAENDDRGLWIAPDRIMFWTTLLGNFAKPIFDAHSQSEALNWSKRFPPGSVLPGDRFESTVRAEARWRTPLFLVLGQGFFMLVAYLLFLSMFTVIPVILRGSEAVGGVRVSLCVNLYCSVIPFILATVYSRVAPNTLHFMTVFVFAFFGYLIWAFSRVRRFLSGG